MDSAGHGRRAKPTIGAFVYNIIARKARALWRARDYEHSWCGDHHLVCWLVSHHQLPTEPGVFGDIHICEVVTDQVTYTNHVRWCVVAAKGAAPPPRHHHAAVAVRLENKGHNHVSVIAWSLGGWPLGLHMLLTQTSSQLVISLDQQHAIAGHRWGVWTPTLG